MKKLVCLIFLLSGCASPELCREGRIYFMEGKWEDAYHAFSTCLEKYPENAELYRLRGLASFRMERYEDAVRDIEKAIEINPDRSIYYVDLAKIYHAKGEREVCLQYYTKAIEKEPQNHDFYEWRAMVYFEMGEYRKAAEDLTLALRYSVVKMPLRCKRMRMYALAGMLDEAIKETRELWEFFGEKAQLHGELAFLYFWKGECDSAVFHFTRAIEEGGSPDLYFWRGLVYYFMGETENALGDVNQGREKAGSGIQKTFFNALYALIKKDHVQAVKEFDYLIENMPSVGDFYYLRGEAYRLMGKSEEAEKDWEKAHFFNNNYPLRWRKGLDKENIKE